MLQKHPRPTPHGNVLRKYENEASKRVAIEGEVRAEIDWWCIVRLSPTCMHFYVWISLSQSQFAPSKPECYNVESAVSAFPNSFWHNFHSRFDEIISVDYVALPSSMWVTLAYMSLKFDKLELRSGVEASVSLSVYNVSWRLAKLISRKLSAFRKKWVKDRRDASKLFVSLSSCC